MLCVSFFSQGTLAELGHAAFARQTLAGGNYELLRCSSAQLDEVGEGTVCDFEPRPSFYVALLWSRLMDRRSLGVDMPSDADPRATQFLRVHANCYAGASGHAGGSSGNGSVAFSVSNSFEPGFDAGGALSFRVSFVGPGGAMDLGGTRLDYLLQSANASAGIFSQSVALNGGAPLQVAPGDAQGAAAALPALAPAVVTGSAAAAALILPPSTVGFVVFPDARVPACM